MNDERLVEVEVVDTSVDEDEVDDKDAHDAVEAVDEADDTEDHDDREVALRSAVVIALGLLLLADATRPHDGCLPLLEGRSAWPSSAYMSCASREDAPVLGMKRLKDEEVGEVGRKVNELVFLEPEKDMVKMVARLAVGRREG